MKYASIIILLLGLAQCNKMSDIKNLYKPSVKPKTVHFSIDDCSLIFKNLNQYNYQSIFEEPVLGKLKYFHDEYGLKVSLYAFYEMNGFCMLDMTDRYAEEFSENSDWLKVAPHALNGQSLANDSITYSFMMEILAKVTKGSLTNTARLEKFQGKLDVLSATGAPLCLLTADSDTSESYYLGGCLCQRMAVDEFYHDTINNKFFYKTDFRLDNPDDFDSLLTANANDDCIVFFTHEWLLETKLRLNVFSMLKSYYKANRIFENLERVCKYVRLYEHEYKTDLDGKYYGK